MANELEMTNAPEEEGLELNPTSLEEISFDDDDLSEFGEEFEANIEETEAQLPANLEGFASRFPDWDLEPPKR